MREWLEKNPMAISFAVAAAVVLLISVTAAGCQMSDLITVDVPNDVKEAVGIEGDVTLTQAPDVWDDWHDYVKRNTDRLEAGTERAYELLGFMNAATEIALTAAEGAAPAFP